MGYVLPTRLKQASARQVTLATDMDLSRLCPTINKVCDSDMYAA